MQITYQAISSGFKKDLADLRRFFKLENQIKSVKSE